MVNDDVKIIEIGLGDHGLLRDFLNSAGSSLESFRYFKKRSFESLKNHITTALVIQGESPIGYGHLDREEDVVWLGIAVSQSSRGKGFGTTLMKFLILKAEENGIEKITLTVDKDNIPAIRLYQQYGFRYAKDVSLKSQRMERCK